ncbi:MAG: Coenzyme F420 hydrogenase/dehydrogenase, beta subunit C-terminal domain [Promethearchaeota archaeon]
MSEKIEIKEVLPKSFEDLIKEVHERDLCGECGGCVSFCSASEIKAIEMSEHGPPRYYNKDNCLHCGICYLVCPQTYVLNEELNAKYEYKIPIGNWRKIVSSQAKSKEILENATDGGVITAILSYLLDHHLINGALVCKKEGPFNRVPFFATSKEELIECAGSHFDLSKQVTGLENYNTFIPTIAKLKSVISPDLISIAVVGTPCQIHSIRKMQELSILPAHIVKYTLGLFCNLNFCFNTSGRKAMEDKFHFSFSEVENMNIRENLMLETKETPIYIEFNELGDVVRKACLGCSDFSNIYADISFGGLGSREEFTTSIIRTKEGEKAYNDALREGYLIEPPSQNSSLKKSEMLAKIISFSKRKMERAKLIQNQ